jgi:hypothetical protein
MNASVFCLCLGLGFGAATVASSAFGEPGPILRPTLVAGAVKPSAGISEAGSEGAEWMLPGGARIVASAGAELRVVGTPQRLQLGPNRDTPGYTVMLRTGTLRVTVPRDGRSAVVVAAPRKTNVLVTAGSASIVAVSDRVAVANTDGEMLLGVGSDPLRPLPVGMLREVDLGAGSFRPLAESPSAFEAPPVAFAFENDATLGAFRWPAGAGVKGYRVEVRDEKGRLVGSRVTQTPGVGAGAFRLAPGKYTARLAGVDPSGLEAARPVERAVRVVGVGIPERAFVDADGAIHFHPGQSVALAHAEGVELTYGGGNYFISAPRTLELMRAEPRLIRFRVAGSAAESKLWLLPREVRAHVEFGPAVPSWPKDALEIVVRVEEPNAGPAGVPVEVHPRVLLGVDPVKVAFVREGNLLRGVLPPQSGKGPWVVRVEVEDQAGTSLGRDFIEVARR